MGGPEKENTTPEGEEECKGLDCAEKTLHESVAQNNPEWVEEDGECQSCVSLEHEMAAAEFEIPKEFNA